jgi:hypothetical protein
LPHKQSFFFPLLQQFSASHTESRRPEPYNRLGTCASKGFDVFLDLLPPKKKDHGGQKLTMVVKHQEVWSIGETDSFAAERAGLHSRQMAQGLPGRIESKWLSDEEVKEAVNLQLDEVELFRQLFEQVLTYYTVRLALSSYCQISCKYTCQETAVYASCM